VLGALGAALVALALWVGFLLGSGPTSFDAPALAFALLAPLAVYGAAVAWVVRRRPTTRAAIVVVVLVAVALRLVFAFDGRPTLSDDIYRYVWDGRVQTHAINPYRHAPDDAALAELRDDEIWPFVNRASERTIYPPVAQGIFALSYVLHPDSVVWTKLFLIGVDIVAIGLLMALLARLGIPRERALLYAWHPLVVVEVGHSGHVDTVLVPLLLLAVHAAISRRRALAGVLVAGAALVKFYAAAVLPALVRRGDRRRLDFLTPLAFLAAFVLAYLPFLGVGADVLGYLPGYLEEEGFSSGRRFYAVRRLDELGWPTPPVEAYQAFIVVAFCLLALWSWLRPPARPRDVGTRALVLYVAFLVLVTPTHPWYRVLALALVPLARGPILLPAVYAGASAPVLYVYLRAPGSPNPEWPLEVAYGGTAVAVALAGVWALVARRGARANSAIPAENETRARKPSESAARRVEAKT
jgi:alpha-1,6-mannosyltransferase